MILLVFGAIMVLAVSILWVVLLGSRWGYLLSVSAVLLLNFWLLLALLAGVGATRIAIVPTIMSVWSVAGIAGLTAVIRGSRRSATRWNWSWRRVVTWLPLFLGSALWLVVVIVSQFVKDAARVSWAMTGDAANNVLFAREILSQPGVVFGPEGNPVPLPSAVAAAVMAWGRDGVASAELLRHDVFAFTFAWAALIAITCATAGLAAAAIARSHGVRDAVVSFTGAAASLLPLSWFFTGYPVEFGFFNVHVALPIVFAAVAVYFGSDRRPAVALSFLTFAATLLLASWSPLVLIPASLGVVIVIRHWRHVFAIRRGQVWLLIVGVVQLLTYGVFVVVPSLLALGGSLAAAGGAVAFVKWMLPGAAIVMIGLAVISKRKANSTALFGAIALSCGALTGLATLLATSLHGTQIWTYYPLKLAWLMTSILFVYSMGLLLPALTRKFGSNSVLFVSGGVLMVVTLAFGLVAPSTSDGKPRQPIFVRILGGEVTGLGDEVADQIFDLADSRQPRILWQSDNPHQNTINFWLLQMASESAEDGFALRAAAYDAFTMTKTTQLCSILYLIGLGAEVLTANPALSSEVKSTCDSAGADVKLIPQPSG